MELGGKLLHMRVVHRYCGVRFSSATVLGNKLCFSPFVCVWMVFINGSREQMVSWVFVIFMDSPSPLHTSGVKMTQRCQLLADYVLSCFQSTLEGLFVTFGGC